MMHLDREGLAAIPGSSQDSFNRCYENITLAKLYSH